MKPATSLCGMRRLVGIRCCTNTSPPTASNMARQIKERPVIMRIESLLRAPLPELPGVGQDTISSQKRQRSLSYRHESRKWSHEPLRTLLVRTRMNKAELVCLLALQRYIGTQPQRDVGRLHRLPYHPNQIVTQGV